MFRFFEYTLPNVRHRIFAKDLSGSMLLSYCWVIPKILNTNMSIFTVFPYSQTFWMRGQVQNTLSRTRTFHFYHIDFAAPSRMHVSVHKRSGLANCCTDRCPISSLDFMYQSSVRLYNFELISSGKHSQIVPFSQRIFYRSPRCQHGYEFFIFFNSTLRDDCRLIETPPISKWSYRFNAACEWCWPLEWYDYFGVAFSNI